jgi:hypothetical protein
MHVSVFKCSIVGLAFLVPSVCHAQGKGGGRQGGGGSGGKCMSSQSATSSTSSSTTSSSSSTSSSRQNFRNLLQPGNQPPLIQQGLQPPQPDLLQQALKQQQQLLQQALQVKEQQQLLQQALQQQQQLQQALAQQQPLQQGIAGNQQQAALQNLQNLAAQQSDTVLQKSLSSSNASVRYVAAQELNRREAPSARIINPFGGPGQ